MLSVFFASPFCLDSESLILTVLLLGVFFSETCNLMRLQCLLLLLMPALVPATLRSWQQNKISTTSPTSTEGHLRTVRSLGNPLVMGDGRFVACSGANLLCFGNNGTFMWIIPLRHQCRLDIAPISDDGGKIYLVAANRVLKITPSNLRSSQPASEIFFGEGSIFAGSDEIIGISLSILYTSLFVSVRNRGLFALLLKGELLWSAGPMLYRFGYRQGCKNNIKDCYFDSVPAVDQCEGTVYVSNTEGQVYSLYIRSPHFRWIQDFSSVDKMINIVSGNNGHLYLIFPRKAVVISLDASTGNVSWQSDVGPLSTETIFPVVDSNGWLSIGSLDGFLYSFSPTGDLKKFLQKTAEDSVILASPVLHCSGFAVYVSQTITEEKSTHTTGDYTFISALMPLSTVITLIVPRTGAVYWQDNYHGNVSSLLSESDLSYFNLDERVFLTILSLRRIGSSLPCYTTGQRIAWTCSQSNPKFITIDASNEEAIMLFLLFQFVILLILAIAVRYCYIFWRKKKLQNHGLGRFLEKRRSLHSRKKTFSRMISELEQKAAEDTTNDEALEQLGEVVRAKEGVERKLSTSYSLGSDRSKAKQRRESILPLYAGRSKSYSFSSGRRASVTIFNTHSEASSDESRNSSSRSSSAQEEAMLESEEVEEAGPSSRVDLVEGNSGEGPSRAAPGAGTLTNPMSMEHQQGESSEQEQAAVLMTEPPMKEGASMRMRRMWLKRRRTLSSTN